MKDLSFPPRSGTTRFAKALWPTKLTLVLTLSLVTLTGCTQYWWERGQAPSVATLIERSSTDLNNNLASFAGTRGDIVPSAKAIAQSLSNALSVAEKRGDKTELVKHLTEARDQLLNIDQKLSIGSRAPYGELVGQLRVFLDSATKDGQVDYPAFGMFTARTNFFFASELTVPAPVPGPVVG